MQEGEHLEAYVLSAMNGRAELSVEPSQRMNVNQTLEDLLMGDPTAEEGQEGSDEVPLLRSSFLPCTCMQPSGLKKPPFDNLH